MIDINQRWFTEEVLGSPVAFWISPDGRHLAFATFNDTNVRDIVISKYGSPGNLKDQYPNEIKIKYPKVDIRSYIYIYIYILHFRRDKKKEKEKKKFPLRLPFSTRKNKSSKGIDRLRDWQRNEDWETTGCWFKRGRKGLYPLKYTDPKQEFVWIKIQVYVYFTFFRFSNSRRELRTRSCPWAWSTCTIPPRNRSIFGRLSMLLEREYTQKSRGSVHITISHSSILILILRWIDFSITPSPRQR